MRFEPFLNSMVVNGLKDTVLGLLSGFPYKSLHFVGHAHTELGAPVGLAGLA